MRSTAMKLMGAVLALALVATLSTPIALADFQECVDACVEQWEADQLACEEALAERLAELDLEAQQCIEDNQGDLIATGLCLRDVNIKRAVANREYRDCISTANTVAYNCYRACQQSPAAP